MNITQKNFQNATAYALPSFLINTTLSQLLISVYPEFNWAEGMVLDFQLPFLEWLRKEQHVSQYEYDAIIWELSHDSNQFWSKLEYQRLFLDWAGSEVLKLETVPDWNNVSKKQVLNAGGKQLLEIYNDSVSEMCQEIYPEFPHQVSGMSLLNSLLLCMCLFVKEYQVLSV